MKVTTFAEDVVLPKNQRTGQKTPAITLQNNEASGFIWPTVNASVNGEHMDEASQLQLNHTQVFIDESSPLKPKYVPVFMLGISLIQV